MFVHSVHKPPFRIFSHLSPFNSNEYISLSEQISLGSFSPKRRLQGLKTPSESDESRRSGLAKADRWVRFGKRTHRFPATFYCVTNWNAAG
jgi:hypothetical protein